MFHAALLELRHSMNIYERLSEGAFEPVNPGKNEKNVRKTAHAKKNSILLKFSLRDALCSRRWENWAGFLRVVR